MLDHPKTRRSALTRRDFLMRSAMAGLAVPSLAAILAACSSSETSSGGGGASTAAGLKLASPDNPVTLPLSDANAAIADGLQAEAGPLQIFGYEDYIWKKVLNEFEDRFNTKIQYTVFDTPEALMAKLLSNGSDFDLIVGLTPENVGKAAAGELIQPLNKSYLPNVAEQLWPELPDYYDVGWQYTTPYTMFTTGIAWRNDLVKQDIAAMDNPWDILWDTKLKGKVHLLNGARDTLATGLMRNGYDPNESDPDVLEKVKQDMLAGADSMNWKFDHVDYTELSTSQWDVHNAWSGSMGYYQYYLPKGVDITAITYLWPPQASSPQKGLFGNDLFAIPKGAASPVLAHNMINFMYDAKIALQNYTYETYQPPVKSFDEHVATTKGYLPPNLGNTIITPDMIPLGVTVLELEPTVNQLYEKIYLEITGGA